MSFPVEANPRRSWNRIRFDHLKAERGERWRKAMTNFDPSNPMPQSIPGVHVPGTFTPLNAAVPWIENRQPSKAAAMSPADAEAKRQRDIALKAEREQRLRERCESVVALTDPVERLVAAVASFVQRRVDVMDPHSSDHEKYFTADATSLRRCLPGLWPDNSEPSFAEDAPWDSAQVARWFASRAGSPSDSIPIERSGFLGSKKPTMIPGWTFPAGSAVWLESKERRGRGNYRDISVLRDGRVIFGGVPSDVGLNAVALTRMAETLGLVAPPPPQPSAEESLRNIFRSMGG